MAVAMALAAAACAGPPAEEADVEQAIETLEAEVRAADVAFDRAVQSGDLETFADLVAEDAVFYGSTAAIEGREEVVASWSAFFDPESGSSITWVPQTVDVASSGDLGYTRGEYRMEVVGEDGTPGFYGGSYVTIWRRSHDGKWRAVLDIGTPSQPIQP